jgi:two-component system, OmpR family, KDP operon response regulator KdpE
MTTAMHQVLLVEDEPGIRAVVRLMLQSAGYRVIEADTAARAEIEARTHKPDLLIVDLGLPDGDGLQVIRSVRSWSPVPIIVLSARIMEEQKVAALDAGADDFVSKPFGSPELLARVRAALRRSVRPATVVAQLTVGRSVIDLARRSALTDGRELHLTPLEYRVLECLSRNAGMIVTQRQLLREAWGPDRLGDTRSLRVCIRNMRAKLEPDPSRPKYIVTEAGLGYRLRLDDPPDADRDRVGRGDVSTAG